MNIESIELRDLSYLVAVHRHGSLTAAAAAIGVAQPTLSHAMARLEQALGQPLWHRPASRRNPLRPTQAGDLLRRRALRMLAEAWAIGEDLEALKGLHHGRLRLGCIPSLMAGSLPSALADLRADHPGLELRVQTVRSEAWRQPLEQGLVDAVLVADDGSGVAPYRAEPCGHQRFVAVLKAGHPLAGATRLALRRLREEELLLVPHDTITGGLIARACQHAGFTAEPSLVLDSPEGLRELVRRDCGISILPEGYVAPGDPDLRCVPLERPVLRRPVVLIHPDLIDESPALSAFHHRIRAGDTA